MRKSTTSLSTNEKLISQCRELREKGLAAKTIAEQLSISVSTVLRICKTNLIMPGFRAVRKSGYIIKRPKAYLYQALYNKGVRMPEIAKQFSVTKQAVSGVLKKVGKIEMEVYRKPVESGSATDKKREYWRERQAEHRNKGKQRTINDNSRPWYLDYK